MSPFRNLLVSNSVGTMNANQMREFGNNLTSSSDYNDREKDARAIVEERVFAKWDAIASGRLEVVATHSDPNLSPIDMDVKSDHILHLYWNTDIDYRPLDPDMDHLSPWLKDIYKGDYNKFIDHFESLSPDEIKKKLDLRESLMRYSAIFHVVKGAKVDHPQTAADAERVSKGHVKILTKILELGGRVNIQDISGNSPLHICADEVHGERFVNKTTLVMARMLLEHGADPNIRNRLGRNPLMSCMYPNGVKYASVLVEFGGDPTLKCNSGMFAQSISHIYPELDAIYTAADKQKVKTARKASKETNELKKCLVCKSPANKRCSACYLVWYCGAECQRGDWSNHKSACKARRKEYIGVFGMVGLSGGSWSVDQAQNSGYQVIKIKFDNEALHVSNKDNSLFGDILDDEEAGETLGPIIKSKGLNGLKGYFSSFLKKGALYVHPAILPPETW